jgi:sulfite exporter TauE/SafE
MQGAIIMSLFALGTAPGLLSIGGLSSSLKGSKAKLFFAAAGLAVIFLGIFNISNASRIVFSEEIEVKSQPESFSKYKDEVPSVLRSEADACDSRFLSLPRRLVA